MTERASSRMGPKRLAALGGVVVLGTAVIMAANSSALLPEAASTEMELSIELVFGTYLDMDLPEQDVYLKGTNGSGKVYRVTKGDNDMGAQLYRAAEMVRHDPFNPDAGGPYPKGEALGITLSEWLRHQGAGSYTCAGGEGRLNTTFSGLVPNGVYTMWHVFMARPPTTPFTGTLDLPLGARDGSTSRFVADADGDAAFTHTFRPCLQLSDVWTTSLLAIAYHSNGKTYGADPGQWGLNSHMPLFLMLPNRAGI